MEEILPDALMIGVDYDLFWTLTPKSLSPFVKAFRLKQEYEDAQAWRLGGYIKMAIASSFSKNAKYPEKPLSMADKVIEAPMEVIKDKFLRHMKEVNRRFGKED